MNNALRNMASLAGLAVIVGLSWQLIALLHVPPLGIPPNLRIAAESAAVRHGITPVQRYVQFIESGEWEKNPAHLSLEMARKCGLLGLGDAYENVECGAIHLGSYVAKAGSVTAGIQAFCAASKVCGGAA